MSNQIAIRKSETSIFSDIATFENGQRIAKVLVQSNLVPAAYQNNIPNAMIALELANRIGISPFMVMQNLDIIKGKPTWSGAFVIAALNSCGRFTPLRFEFFGTEKTNDWGCVAVAFDKEGNELRSPKVTWKMAQEEGWINKPGSKWKTMPELMFHYRTASFFGRIYAPDILKGMHTPEEVIDSVTESETIDLDRLNHEEEKNRLVHFMATTETIEELEEVRSDAKELELESDLDKRIEELKK